MNVPITQSRLPSFRAPRSRRPLLMLVAALGLVALGAGAAVLVMRAPQPAAGVVSETVPTRPAAPAPAAPKPTPNSRSTPLDTQPALAQPESCRNCGVVQSVTEVHRQGEATGLGAAAGTLIGGVLGHQMGGGSGKQAMTVIGAVGGGVAGHEIEKRRRATTEYQVRVRLPDGSTRSFTQAKPLPVGQPVLIEDQKLVAVEPPPAAGTAPRTLQTGSRS